MTLEELSFESVNGQTDNRTDVPKIMVMGLRPTVNFHRVLKAISSLTQRFVMSLYKIKHNAVTKLSPPNPKCWLGWTDRRMTDKK